MSDSAETDKQDPKTSAQLSDSPETDIQTPKPAYERPILQKRTLHTA